jgi:CRISPR-associated protein Csx17
VALPAGSFPVQYRSEADLVRELDSLLHNVDRFIVAFQGAEPPARFTSLRRQIDEAIYDLLLRGGADRVARLIATVGRMEKLFAQRDLSKEPKLAAPLVGLSPRWILAADDGSIELRLAAALASLTACGKVGPLRANLAPVDPAKPWEWARKNLQTAWSGSTVQGRLAEVLTRRMMDAERLNAPANPVAARITLHPLDAVALVTGRLDAGRLEDLLFGMTWIRWDAAPASVAAYREASRRWAVPLRDSVMPRPYALLKHLFLPEGIRLPGQVKMISIRAEPSVIPLLRANRISQACAVAQRRLFASGLAVVRSIFPDSAQGTALAAALLVPVRPSARLTQMILQDKTTNT